MNALMLLRWAVIVLCLTACASEREHEHEPPEPASGGCLEGSDDAADAPPARSSFVLLPDTQFYACMYPEIFEAQTDWVVRERTNEGIAIAVHTGDIVDQPFDRDEWAVAAEAMHALDGEVPYLMALGNHEIDGARRDYLSDYFSQEDLGGELPGVAMCFRYEDRVNGSYALVELREQRWLFLSLEFGPRDAELEWADEVLREHASVPAVIFTHAYLYSDGTRYDRSVEPLQPYHPDQYGVTPGAGINDGQDIWEKLVEPNRSVKLVLSGHVIPDGTARAVSEREDGSRVHEVLTNYQMCDSCPCESVNGGNGYLRVFTLSEDRSELSVRTYSPSLDEELSDDENAFVLEL
jgi:hypothetical protein